MEAILIGAAVTIVTELVKRITRMFASNDLAKSVVILLTLGLSIAGGVGYYYFQHTLSPDTITKVAGIWVTSVGVFELLFKNVINPSIAKLGIKQV